MLIVWVAFIVLVLILLALDLGVFHRKSHEITIREALAWTAFWVFIAMLFNVLVYFLYERHWLGIGLDIGHPLDGRDAALKFLTGYLLEKSLSVDNIFVIAMIFSYFAVPTIYQHRVLFWGIIGALVMRGVMIGIGTELIERLSWMIYVFGGLLIVTAIKMLLAREEKIEPERNPLVRLARRIYPVTPAFEGPKFFSTINGRRAITPMFIVLLVIESTDLLFAIDSIPAIIGVTSDPFIVYTSNVFAILGLRSLYFALAGMMNKFRYLKISIVFLLAFIGAKMIVAHYLRTPERPEVVPTEVSLAIIAGILFLGVVASLVADRRGKAHE